MNESDIAGIVFILVGLLCLLPAVLFSAVFVVVSGGFIAAGIVLIISAGSTCRAPQDVAPGSDRVHAELKVAKAPSLAKIPA
jgi:hypothetical protein